MSLVNNFFSKSKFNEINDVLQNVELLVLRTLADGQKSCSFTQNRFSRFTTEDSSYSNLPFNYHFDFG